jgi:hypothetical protein
MSRTGQLYRDNEDRRLRELASEYARLAACGREVPCRHDCQCWERAFWDLVDDSQQQDDER